MHSGFGVALNVACVALVFSIATTSTLQEQWGVNSIREGLRSLLNHPGGRKLQGDQHLMISAAVRGDTKMVQFYIDWGVDVDIENGRGWTALSAAASFNRLSTAKILIGSGADVNHKSADSNEALTPLMIASFVGDGDMMALLMEAGADRTLTSIQGVTAEGLLCTCTQIELDEYLRPFCNFKGCEDSAQLWGGQSGDARTALN